MSREVALNEMHLTDGSVVLRTSGKLSHYNTIVNGHCWLVSIKNNLVKLGIKPSPPAVARYVILPVSEVNDNTFTFVRPLTRAEREAFDLHSIEHLDGRRFSLREGQTYRRTGRLFGADFYPKPPPFNTDLSIFRIGHARTRLEYKDSDGVFCLTAVKHCQITDAYFKRIRYS